MGRRSISASGSLISGLRRLPDLHSLAQKVGQRQDSGSNRQKSGTAGPLNPKLFVAAGPAEPDRPPLTEDQRAIRERVSLGVLPVQRLNACVNALTSR